MSQLDMFAPSAPPKARLPTAESVRPKLQAVLSQLRSGKALAWTDAELRRWRVVFPQMCDWLPESERERTRLEFQELADRLRKVAVG